MGNPARALDAHAAGGAEHADDARGRATNAECMGKPRVGRRDRCRRARDRREGIDARECVEDLLRGDDSVQSPQHRGPLCAVPEIGLCWKQERDGAQHPDDGEPRNGAQREAAGRVERAHAGLPNARAE